MSTGFRPKLLASPLMRSSSLMPASPFLFGDPPEPLLDEAPDGVVVEVEPAGLGDRPVHDPAEVGLEDALGVRPGPLGDNGARCLSGSR